MDLCFTLPHGPHGVWGWPRMHIFHSWHMPWNFYWWHFMIRLQKLELIFGQSDGGQTDGRRTDRRGSRNSYLDFSFFFRMQLINWHWNHFSFCFIIDIVSNFLNAVKMSKTQVSERIKRKSLCRTTEVKLPAFIFYYFLWVNHQIFQKTLKIYPLLYLISILIIFTKTHLCVQAKINSLSCVRSATKPHNPCILSLSDLSHIVGTIVNFHLYHFFAW